MGTSSFTGPSGSGWTGWNTGYQGAGLYSSFGTAASASSPASTPIPSPTPVQPTFDPKIEANALYGKPMALAAIGSKPVRFGGSPAPLVGPYINAGLVDFLVSIALVVPVDGTRKLFKVYLDQELAWSSATGWDGSGAQPGDAVYHAETFDLAFRPGTLTQAVLSLETDKFPGDENAYRPQVLIQIRGLPYQRYMDRSGRPVPYVSCEIGDFSNGRGPDEQINLGESTELIAHAPWAGYTSDTFETENITDVVDGTILKDNFTVVDLGRSHTRIYRNLDLLQSDKLRIKDRASVTPDFVFDRDSIIGGEQAVQLIRSGATAQRRELELIAIDPDQDYTAVPSLAQIPRSPFVISAAVGKETITSPLVLDASTRQALVTYAQQYEENARKKVALRVGAYGYEIEPGDLFALPDTVADGIDGEVFKCTQTEHGANYETQIEGEAILRCSVYSNDTTGFDPATVSNVILSNSNLTATHSGTANNSGARTASQQSSGKYYFEYTATLLSGFFDCCGVLTAAGTYTNFVTDGTNCAAVYLGTGSIWTNNADTTVDLAPRAPGMVIGWAVDLDNNRVWVRRVDLPGDWNMDSGADPATNTGGFSISNYAATTMSPAAGFGGSGTANGDNGTANFGATSFVGDVPSGFTAGWPV